MPEAARIDIDILGVDLGLGAPVVAFQVGKSDANPQLTYDIYSLQTPPRMLRSITGGNFFKAVDTDLDGRIELWAGDAAIDGFDDLYLVDFDFAPTVALRFEKGRLVDVSSEFQPYFDRQIAEARSHLDALALNDFRNSDGKVSQRFGVSPDQLHRLLTTKIRVLEIVLAYLYSGREKEAWEVLAEMWPPADIDRVRAAILAMRARGIRSEVDGVSEPSSHPHKNKHAMIYETADRAMDTEGNSGSSVLSLRTMGNPPASTNARDSSTVDVKPRPIYLHMPPSSETPLALPSTGINLDLVIDAAGKVRSAKPAGKVDDTDLEASLIKASAEWKFIPAFKDEHPVASRLRFTVLNLQ